MLLTKRSCGFTGECGAAAAAQRSLPPPAMTGEIRRGSAYCLLIAWVFSHMGGTVLPCKHMSTWKQGLRQLCTAERSSWEKSLLTGLARKGRRQHWFGESLRNTVLVYNPLLPCRYLFLWVICRLFIENEISLRNTNLVSMSFISCVLINCCAVPGQIESEVIPRPSSSNQFLQMVL